MARKADKLLDQLHRREAHSAGRGVDQNALVLAQLALGVQGVVSRQEGDRDGGGLLEAHVGR